ncbi:MAG: ABC transporter substrate-binding protein [Chloroflexota bacterium]
MVRISEHGLYAMMNRRKLLQFALGGSLAGLLAACSVEQDDDNGSGADDQQASEDSDESDNGQSDESDTDQQETPESDETEEATPTEQAETDPENGNGSAGFPVEIEHKFGATEIAEQPERVVTIGYTEHDPALALGVQPVAVREWFGEQPHAVWPWATDELGDAEPEVLNMPFGELDFEAIVALEPDVLFATHSGITEEEYENLDQIAPTVAQSGEYPDFAMPWQEQTRIIGRALGQEDRAEELVSSVEEEIETTAEAHPEFSDATLTWINPQGDGQYWVVGPTTPPLQFLQQLGFRMTDELVDLAGDADSAEISSEQLHLVDTDVLIIRVGTEEERETLESNELFQQLEVVQDGRTIFFVGVDDPIYGALSFSTVLSLPFAIDELTPLLVEALEGELAEASS